MCALQKTQPKCGQLLGNNGSGRNIVSFSAADSMKGDGTDQDARNDAEKIGLVMEGSNEDLVDTTKRKIEEELVSEEPHALQSIVRVAEFLKAMEVT